MRCSANLALFLKNTLNTSIQWRGGTLVSRVARSLLAPPLYKHKKSWSGTGGRGSPLSKDKIRNLCIL